jgi:hypothetical protein
MSCGYPLLTSFAPRVVKSEHHVILSLCDVMSPPVSRKWHNSITPSQRRAVTAAFNFADSTMISVHAMQRQDGDNVTKWSCSTVETGAFRMVCACVAGSARRRPFSYGKIGRMTRASGYVDAGTRSTSCLLPGKEFGNTTILVKSIERYVVKSGSDAVTPCHSGHRPVTIMN